LRPDKGGDFLNRLVVLKPFDDFFDVLFGQGRGGRRRTGARPGNDLEYRLAISLGEAAAGCKRTFRFARREACNECNGSGAMPGTQPQACVDCSGTGQIRRAQGFFSISQTCPRCRGTGRIIQKPCSRCSGSGRYRAERELSVDLPAGIDTGSRLRLSGEGEPGENGGPRGDLYIFVEVEPHEIFEREGNNIVCDMPISFPQGSARVPQRRPTRPRSGRNPDQTLPRTTRTNRAVPGNQQREVVPHLPPLH